VNIFDMNALFTRIRGKVGSVRAQPAAAALAEIAIKATDLPENEKEA
jgi:hypothetical protein